MKIIDTEDGEQVAEIICAGSMTVEDALAAAGLEQVTDDTDYNCGLWTLGDGVYYDAAKLSLEV